MKKLILPSLILLALAACKKEEKISPKAPQLIATALLVTKPDTIPDSAMLKIKLGADSINTDETLFIFNHKSSPRYVFNEDAPYFQGFGQVSLASISSDGKDLAINGLPYTFGTSIGLDVHTKNNGIYFLEISYQKKIPSNTQIWIKDSYLKDSVDLCTRNCTFNVSKADTNSFGSKRFKLVLTHHAQQQTATAH